MLISSILFVTAFVATVLSTMSGGGSSVIAIPIFLSLGISFPLALAAQKLSQVFWVLPAGYNYLKGKKIDWLFLILFSLLGMVGVYLGVRFVLASHQRTLEIIVGVIILVLVSYTYFDKNLGLREHIVASPWRRMLAYPTALVMGFYESILGSGNGILFAIVSFFTRGFDFTDALGYNYVIAFPWVTFAAVFLMYQGYFDVRIMTPVVLGSLAGGYLGSKLGRYKGNKFIKAVFVIVGGILGIKLLIGM